MERIQLSKNFFLDEFLESDTAIRHGIDIVVEEDSAIFHRLKNYAQTIAQPIRDEAGRIDLWSGYRPLKVNRLVDSSDNSQHIDGDAGDLRPREVTPYELCQIVVDLELPFDQMIYEFGRWCHISQAPEGREPRFEILTSYKYITANRKPKTKYVSGLHIIESLTRGAA